MHTAVKVKGERLYSVWDCKAQHRKLRARMRDGHPPTVLEAEGGTPVPGPSPSGTREASPLPSLWRPSRLASWACSCAAPFCASVTPQRFSCASVSLCCPICIRTVIAGESPANDRIFTDHFCKELISKGSHTYELQAEDFNAS